MRFDYENVGKQLSCEWNGGEIDLWTKCRPINYRMTFVLHLCLLDILVLIAIVECTVPPRPALI